MANSVCVECGVDIGNSGRLCYECCGNKIGLKATAKTAPNFISTWTPYTMPIRPSRGVFKPADLGGISAERITEVLEDRNPPHTREEIRAAKAQLEAVMHEKGLPIPNEQ